MDTAEWLDQLSAGDTVIIDTFGGPKIGEVYRTTATQVVVGNRKYHRKNGQAVGRDSWSIDAIMEPTPDRVKTARHNFLKAYVGAKARTFANTATTEQLEKVAVLIKQAIKEQKEN